MPRPLASFGDKVKQIYLSNSNDSPARQRQALALLAMNVIAEYSILDSFFRSMFVSMLGENPRPAAAVYSSLNSDAAKRDAFRAVGRAFLSPEEQDVLEALFALQKTCAKTRNKIAHWTWGHSPQLPDMVLLADPVDHTQNSIDYQEAYKLYRNKRLAKMLMGEEGRAVAEPDHPEENRDGIYAFDQKDFLDASKDIQRVIQLVMQFRWLLNRRDPGHRDGSILAQLSAEPEVREFLDHLLERRKKSQEAQQQQNKKPDPQETGGA